LASKQLNIKYKITKFIIYKLLAQFS